MVLLGPGVMDVAKANSAVAETAEPGRSIIVRIDGVQVCQIPSLPQALPPCRLPPCLHAALAA
jgi:hypothetical protein